MRKSREVELNHRKPRLLIAEDSEAISAALASLVSPSFDVVGICSNGADAVHFASALQPDVVLMDVVMPILDGIQATRQIRALDRETKIVMVSGLEDEQFVKAAIAAGAQKYVFKRQISTELIAAIDAVLSPGTPVCAPDELSQVGEPRN